MEITPSRALEALKVCYQINRPVFMWGPPGIGKTETVYALGKMLKVPVIVWIAAQTDAVDIKGIPGKIIDENGIARTEWAAPKDLPFLDPDWEGILFFDELPNATPLVQNSIQQCIHERRVGEHRLSDKARVFAAGNRQSDRAGAGRLSTAIASRFVQLEITPDTLEWADWAVKKGVNHLTVNFIRKVRPELLHKFDGNESSFPCPRTWEFCGEITDKVGKKEVSSDIARALYYGAVGEAAGIEYAAYIEEAQDLPDLDLVMNEPKKAPLPNTNKPSQLYAMAAGVGTRMRDKDTAAAGLTYLKRLTEASNQAEYEILSFMDVVSAVGKECLTWPAFEEWATHHKKLFQS